jgi:hypothetical protein
VSEPEARGAEPGADPGVPAAELGPAGQGSSGLGPEVPDLSFEISAVEPAPNAAAPTLRFRLEVSEGSGRQIFAIALATSIEIELAERRYDEATRERLVELLGEVGRVGAPVRSMHWTRVDALVPAFSGSTSHGIEVPCTYDLEVAATKYFHALADGEAPLAFHFNGNVYYQGDRERLQIVQIPWDLSTSFRMPVEAWRRMIEIHYPFRGWVPLHTETIDALRRFKTQRGLPTFDVAVERLLALGGEEDDGL